jgi:hypothetical protein
LRRLLSVALLLLLLLAAVPLQQNARAQSAPMVSVTSFYSLNTYGYAVVNETVTFTNNQTSPVSIPSVQIGLGNLSSLVASSALSGGNFTMTPTLSQGGPFTVQANGELAGGSKTSFTISSLVSGEVNVAKNGSLTVLALLHPSLSIPVQTLKQVILMPSLTRYRYVPKGFSWTQTATNNTYIMTETNVPSGGALTSAPYLFKTTSASFFPLFVTRASRTITVESNGTPIVTDTVEVVNQGYSSLATLIVSPLTTADALITIVPQSEPKLLNPVTISLTSDTIDLTSAMGSIIAANTNLSIAYQYPLAAKYYSVSGSQVTLNLPDTPPIPNVVRSYTIRISVPPGMSLIQGQSQTILGASQRQTGTTSFSYALQIGWAIDAGIPVASLVFLLLLAGLFVMRETPAKEEEETEEESSGIRVEAMIKAFDEKTNVINGLWPEISARDPNDMRKEYFDELRGRLDALRSKALQRLNEIKQRSTTQKFFDLLNQIHASEREVDRAAKDKLNLYEQYHMRRMRKEVFDRLLPQYTKRLERALDTLSDELHVVQREAKLL